jgi:DNA topoisomerase III
MHWKAIAKGLSGGNYSSGSGKGMPMHEFTGPLFPKAPYASHCKHKVTSVAGHVFSVDFHAKYQSWDSVDPAELFTAPIVKKAQNQGVIRNLEAGARGANFIVLWMDCDREGENINFEVLDCCMHCMQSGGTSSNFDRVCK